MSDITDEVLLELLLAVTPNVIADPEILADWSMDWWSLTAKTGIDDDRIPTTAVVPECAIDVAEIVRVAAAHRRQIVIRGGGSNTAGALAPSAGAILLDTRGLNVIGPIDEINGTVVVDAGVMGGELEERLTELGFTLGFDPDSLHYSTVGGWIATRAVAQVAMDGHGIEDLVEGLTVVLADGTTRELSSPHIGAYVGSEGGLGIIVSATLQIRTLPELQLHCAWSASDFDAVADAIRRGIQSGASPSVIQLFDRNAITILPDLSDPSSMELLVIAQCSGPEHLEAARMEHLSELLAAAGAVQLGGDLAEAWLSVRRRTDWLLDALEREGAIADRIHVAVPWSEQAAARTAGMAVLADLDVWCATFLAYPDRTSCTIGFDLVVERSDDETAVADYQVALTALAAAVGVHGDRVSHFRCEGQAHSEQVPAGGRRELKAAFDPDGRFRSPRFGS